MAAAIIRYLIVDTMSQNASHHSGQYLILMSDPVRSHSNSFGPTPSNIGCFTQRSDVRRGNFSIAKNVMNACTS